MKKKGRRKDKYEGEKRQVPFLLTAPPYLPPTTTSLYSVMAAGILRLGGQIYRVLGYRGAGNTT